jgi:hypothetical protein
MHCMAFIWALERYQQAAALSAKKGHGEAIPGLGLGAFIKYRAGGIKHQPQDLESTTHHILRSWLVYLEL